MLKKYSGYALLVLISAMPLLPANAQKPARSSEKVLADDGTPVMIRMSADAVYAVGEAPRALADQLQLRPEDQMRSTRTEADALGFIHEKYQQYYKGIKVEHATYTAHTRQGALESLSGKFERIPSLNITPSLTAEAALKHALSFVGARRYMWQDAQEEAGLKKHENDPKATYQPQGELVIVKNHLATDVKLSGRPVLAWKFNIYAQQPVSRAYIYVDAHTGAIVLKDNIIKHAAATGNFATAYSGTRSIATETTTGGYRLREYTRGNGIETYNCNRGTSYTSATDFVDADNNWTAAEYNNARLDNVAGDAHFGAQATYDYWKTVHNRNSYDNAGAKIKSYVHFNSNYENAFWNGSVMTYGDGATRFRPLTALDVCAHEIGHAVCTSTANLTYSGESGAMNEGLSDIWGACIEQYAITAYSLTGKSVWLIGEEIDKQEEALRSMSDPKSQGQPAYYKGQYWYTGSADGGGVHTNSGVLNHWFYILTQGKSGTNEGGNAYNVTGIGIINAGKIAFRMEDTYMTASSNYANARTYSIQAATDLFGAGSAQVIAVTNAWYAVGIGSAYDGGGGNPPPAGYCVSKGTSQSYEYLDLFKLGTINRTSGADGGYYNGAATSTSLARGASHTVSFSGGFTGSMYTEYYKIYIGYNRNNAFTDAGELVYSTSSSSSGTLAGTFTIPAAVATGPTRVRILISDNSAATSCGTYSYGETEDYTINITSDGNPPPPASYCASKGGSQADEYMDLFKLGTINRTSGADGGYYNGTGTSTSLAAGSSQTVSFSAGFAGTAYTEYFKIYIDYNGNGVFTDSGELVYSTSPNSAATLSGTFTVPATAKAGATRVRAVMSYTSSTTSCGTYQYGETEDYTVNITNSLAAVRQESLGNASLNQKLEVYPNPVADVLYLTLPDGLEARSVQVLDMRGSISTAVRYEGKGSINVANLPRGLYTVSVSDGKQMFYQRFVKQ